MSGVAQRSARPSRAHAPRSPARRRTPSSASRRVGRDSNASTGSFFRLVRHYVNKGVVSPLANLVDPGMLSSQSPPHADDASLLVRTAASDDAMADHELPDADRARDRGGSHEDGSVDSSASGDAARGARPTEKLQRTRDVQYEKSPFAVWMGMLLNLLASALATAGLGVSAALYPLYAVTPTPVLAFLGKNAFNLGYLIYMSPIGRWAHLRAVKSHHRTNQPPHSRGVRPSPLTTCSVLPVPFLADNYAYVLVDHATRECAAIDPADPYGVKDLCDRLDLNMTAILTTHKHHDHAGGNHELQKACGGTLAVYGHALDDCAGVTRRVSPGDVVRVGQTRLGVVHVPCHTTGHVVYAVLGNGDGADGDRSETVSPAGPGSVDERASDVVGNDDGGGGADAFDARRVEALFTGDAVINGGVGAFFHGTPRDCYDNLHVRLRKMPDAALVFSGHEYMQMNLKYARWLDESCEATSSAARQVAARRHRGLSTMPSSLAVERRVNPYFRVRDRAYVDKIQRLERHLERGKRRRWYRRYFPERRGKDAADERARADRGIVAAEDVELGGLGEVPAPPTTAESLRCIETLQSLTQYRHLIEDEPIEAPRASRRDGSGAEGEADGEPVERTSTGRRRAPAPGPVAL